MRESRIEKRLVEKCKSKKAVVIKLGTSGLPDRLILKNGFVWFVETKAPGKKPRSLQQYWHRILSEEGFEVLVIDSLEAVDRFVEDL